ncbi:pyridoxal-phosphate dependent enzyme [Streptomyces sp. RS10V-4]|uniref:pyridoxal-phosphate dependent enzyme n=1 Tax=Streptomyces rhizoryzae TaxID=2932493 RepID=UPI0020050A74|nr:pyridoxal-phosphate dependent enzyme [Streptomyces rhizoryzae]MCK7626968.1 pyridoxal-phosphate dependent enzyme [Streptomyces rhizoryzae]
MTAPAPPADGSWAARALAALAADAAPTPLRPVPLPALPAVGLYVKDESAQPTGSIKHRLLRELFRTAVAEGALTAGTPVVMGSGGAAAVAGARLAGLLDLPFTAVLPRTAPPAVRTRIEAYGGRCRTGERPPAAVLEEARELAARTGGHFLDHFAGAARRAPDGRPPLPGFAEEILDGLRTTRHPVPAWLVTGAGTGATAASLGARLRHHRPPARLAVADPENSAYFPAWASGCDAYTTGMPSRIPGIGRPRTEPGFRADLVDLVVPVPDAASVAAMRWLERTAGLAAGPAAGTALWAACHLAARLAADGRGGGVVAVAGDGAGPYRATHRDPGWLAAQGLDPAPYEARLDRLAAAGEWNWPEPAGG